VLSYRVILDVPFQLAVFVSGLLAALVLVQFEHKMIS